MAIPEPRQPTHEQVLDLFYHYNANEATAARMEVLRQLFPTVTESNAESLGAQNVQRRGGHEESSVNQTDRAAFEIFVRAHPNRNELIIRYLGLNNWNTAGNKEEAIRRIVECCINQSPTLNLNDLELTQLPASLDKLQCLTSLDCSKNKLFIIPASLGNLQNLKELQLQHNSLFSIPASLGNLQNLRELHLQNNSLISIPESLGNLNDLTRLYLDHNCLTSLPASLGKLEHLARLFVQNNFLTQLPNSLTGLVNLLVLQLENNHLGFIPEWFANFPEATNIYLNNNPALLNPPPRKKPGQGSH